MSKPLCSADVNECEDPLNCKNGHCVDTPGSYYCICSPPWTLAIDRNGCVTPEEQAGESGWRVVESARKKKLYIFSKNRKNLRKRKRIFEPS